jgi:hypothetical protein
VVAFWPFTGVRSIAIGLVAILAVTSAAHAVDTRPRDSSGWVPCSTTFAPLSDSDAAKQVLPMTENRASENANANSVVGDANHYHPSAAELERFLTSETYATGRFPAEVNPYAAYVTGGFVGATDEIIQWGAAKWGIPVDWVRAQYVQESWWNQTARGDLTTVADATRYPAFSRLSVTQVYQSLGISQVKWNHPDARDSGAGTEPLRWKSTAFNVDYQLAWVRFYFDDPAGVRTQWGDSGYSRCGQWLSIAGWFEPYPWGNAGQNEYIGRVQTHLDNRTWEQVSFPPARPVARRPMPPNGLQILP